jgi:hypothetical protein
VEELRKRAAFQQSKLDKAKKKHERMLPKLDRATEALNNQEETEAQQMLREKYEQACRRHQVEITRIWVQIDALRKQIVVCLIFFFFLT